MPLFSFTLICSGNMSKTKCLWQQTCCRIHGTIGTPLLCTCPFIYVACNICARYFYEPRFQFISFLSCVLFTGLPADTLVDRYVTVGAYCLLRSCTIEPECIIGQHSILMEGSLVETNSILEAGSVLPPGRRIPTGELWAGNPARFVRKLTNEEIMEIPKLAVAINDLMQSHFSEFLPYSTAYLEVEKLKKSFSIPL